MNKKEKKLKYLKEIFNTLKNDADNLRRNFINITEKEDFGKYYNIKIGEINMDLINFKFKLEMTEDSLNYDIRILEKNYKK